jgi:hypothetical protein
MDARVAPLSRLYAGDPDVRSTTIAPNVSLPL